MALQKQLIPVLFAPGINQKPDSKVLQSDSSAVLENTSIKKYDKDVGGRIGKRHGYEALSLNIQGGGTLSGNRKLAVLQDELLAVTDSKLYSYNETNDNWIDKGSISAVTIELNALVKKNVNCTNPDVAEINGIRVYAYETNSGTNTLVLDTATNSILLYDYQVSSDHTKPRLIAANDRVYIYYYRAASNSIKCRYLESSAPTTWSSETTFATNAHGTLFAMDLCLMGNNPAFAYVTTTLQTKIGYIKTNGDIAGVLDGLPAAITTAYASAPGGYCLSLFGIYEGGSYDGLYHTYYFDAGGVTQGVITYKWNRNLTSGTSYTVYTRAYDAIERINQIASYVDSSDGMVYVFWEQTQTTRLSSQGYGSYINANTITGAGTVGTAGIIADFNGISGKAFKGVDDQIYITGTHANTLNTSQQSEFLLKYISNSQCEAVVVVAQGYGAGLRSPGLLSSSIDSSNTRIHAGVTVSRFDSASGSLIGVTGISEIVFNYDTANLFSYEVINDILFICGGMPQIYDGVSVFESNFNLYPEIASTANSAGTAIGAGTRNYVVVYEWEDAKGNIYRSTPSVPVSVTVAGGEKTTLTLISLSLTKKIAALNRAKVKVVVYRTKDAATTYYRLTSLTSPLENATSGTLTYEDTAADSAIGANEILYTTGGILENVNPPASGNVSKYKNRLLLTNTEDKGLIRFSKKIARYEGPGFHDTFDIRVDEGQGRIWATEALDDKIIIFKEDDIYVTRGEGPQDTGIEYDYVQPELLSTDAGCPYPSSIIVSPLGLFFKSNKGFYLIDRTLQLTYIGKNVEDYNSLTTEDVDLFENDNEVRWIHSDGVMLVYNYYLNTWSTYTNHEGYGTVKWKQKQVILKTDDSIWVQDDSYSDAGSSIKTKIVTPWIQTGGIQGFQRLYLVKFIGSLVSHHTLKVTTQYNFREEDYESKYYDSAEVQGSDYYGEDSYYGESEYYGGADSLYQFEFRPTIQKCQSIRFIIEDLYPDGATGAGYTLTAMTLRVGVKGTEFKDKTERTIT